MPVQESLDIYSIEDFERGIYSGKFSDKDGKAYIIINGRIQTSYTVHIDRRIISSQGLLVSMKGLLKEHSGKNELQVGYQKNSINLINLEEIIKIRQSKEK